MALFPKIASPCPYLDRFDSIMDGDFCRMCKRQVHDLTAMGDDQRAAFMMECGGQACVSYTMWMKPALAAAALAASAGVVVGLDTALAQTQHPDRAMVRLAGMVAPESMRPVATRKAVPHVRTHKAKHRPRPPALVPVTLAGLIAPPQPAEAPPADKD